MEPNYHVLAGITVVLAVLALLILRRPRPAAEAEVRMLRYMLYLMPTGQALVAERHPSAVMTVRRIGDDYYEAALAGIYELRHMRGSGAAVAVKMGDFQPNPLLWRLDGMEVKNTNDPVGTGRGW